MMDYRRLNREFWGRHLWARGYFACTTATSRTKRSSITSNTKIRAQDDRNFRVTE